MNLSVPYEICAPEVVAEVFDGEIVILNLASGCYFSLNPAGCMVWQALLDGATPRAILDSIPASDSYRTTSVRGFVQRVVELDLIRPRQDASVASASAINWHELTDDANPHIDVFDDLAVLILADPIHDVDAESASRTAA